MKVTIGFSTCPNDTFMFDALMHKRIDTNGIEFEPVMADIKVLNDMASAGKLDITKLSYHAYTKLLKDYVLMDAGSALGHNCGPLLISKAPIQNDQIKNRSVAIPGELTTANLLFSLAYPEHKNKHVMLFSDIEDAVISGNVDLGLIIHENRFTYQEKGLHKIVDLGEYWESTFDYPIPLGGIVAKRSLGTEFIKKISNMIGQSVQYAFDHPTASQDFVLKYAQEMEPDVVKQHIALYVNDYSVALGKRGRGAVEKLFEVSIARNIVQTAEFPIFMD